MNKLVAVVAMSALALGAGTSCKKKDKTGEAGSGSAASSAAGAAEAGAPAKSAAEREAEAKEAAEQAAAEKVEADKEAAEQSAADKEHKQALLEYAQLEDRYLNDAKGQWATAAKASSSFGSAGKEPEGSHSSNTPWQATGAPNGDGWSNDHQDMGIDWLELTYERPVAATELRAVLTSGVGAISKVELRDEAGGFHEVWSGADDTVADRRGPRTWFVRTFEKTPYKAVGIKLSFANAVVRGYKEVDGVQLVGE
jgi:hypothetical protein